LAELEFEYVPWGITAHFEAEKVNVGVLVLQMMVH
jgi:hypothetical protein